MTLQSRLLTLSNLARTREGAPPLCANALLEQVAQSHAEAMAYGGYFDHIDTQGRGVGARLLAAGYNYRWCGENISAGKKQPEHIVQWWLESEGHRMNILKPEFTEAGFGYCFIEQDKNSFHHYWVQVLAAPLIVE